MSKSKLNSAYSRYISDNSEASYNYPKEDEICEVTEPLCNDYVKLRNYYIAKPYNFMMGLKDWNSISNTVEIATAIRFGMEIDMKKQVDSNIWDPAFHTQMYIKFHKYLMQKVMYQASKVVAEFLSATFSTRFLSTFSFDNIKELRNAECSAELAKKSLGEAKKIKANIDKLNVLSAARDMFLINENAGPLHINIDMFIKLFNQDYNPNMVQVLKESGVYLGDPKNVQFNLLNKNSW